jgi:hypothetical protein
VLQPLDVGVNKPFKDRIRNMYMLWAAKNLSGREKAPAPSREEVLLWLKTSWDEITPEVIRNAFKACGYETPTHTVEV